MEIKEDINKNEFEGYIAGKVNNIESTIDNLFIDAKLRNSDIDFVFLTGGSSYVSQIKEIFEERFEGHKIWQFDAFTSVANGLGILSTVFQ